MVNRDLVNYIKEQIKKGFDEETIRSYLSRYGYPSSQVNEAINLIYRPEVKHIIHFSPTTMISIIAVFIGLIVVAFVFLNLLTPKIPDQLLDLNLEPVKTTSGVGGDITFLTEITNLGSAKRYDILIKYELINLKTNEVLTFKEETRGIETVGSKQTRIEIPSDAKPGNYILRAIATYNGRRAVATLPAKIEGELVIPEEPVEEEPKESEEPEEPEEPVEEETKDERTGTDALTTFETLETIEKIAPQNRKEAENLCKKLRLQTSRDLCFNKIAEVLGDKNYCQRIIDERTRDVCLSNVAKIVDRSEICEEITKDSRKDSCYMNFVIDKKDYTVCDKVTNQYLSQSCESLKQLSKLNLTGVSFYESLLNQSLIEFV